MVQSDTGEMSAKRDERISSRGVFERMLIAIFLCCCRFVERQERHFCGIDDIYRDSWNGD